MFAIRISSMRLAMAPVTGRRTVYVRVSFGRRNYWLMRWDTARTPAPRYRPFLVSRDGLMGWTRGVFVTGEAA